MRRLSVSLAILALVLGGCGSEAPPLADSPEAAREQLLTLAPPGTTLAVARALLERAGSLCVNVTARPFGGTGPAEYVFCDLSRGWISQERLRVALVYDDSDLLTDILVEAP